MPFAPKTTQEQFTTEWSKAIGWAQSQGISASSYLPVYQLDLNRIKNGEFPMGTVERNLEILSAHNPNQVTSAPADNPQPSNILTNTVNDANKIATGLIGIFTGSFEKQVWDSAKATYNGIIHPASLAAPTEGGTMANWLDKTLLAYLPGATDLGTLLTKGPAGLAEHPLVSVLDLMGVEGGLEKGLGKVAPDTAAKMAAASGGKGVLGMAGKAIGGSTLGGRLGPGVTLGGQLLEHLSVKDMLGKFAAKIGPGGSGVGPAIGSLAEASAQAGAMATNTYAWLLDGPTQAFKSLNDDQKVLVKQILDTRRTTGGDSVVKAMADPALDPRVKEVVQDWIEGPLRFATEESLFSGQLRPMEALDGQIGMWAPNSRGAESVRLARTGRDVAHRTAVESILRLAPHADMVAKLDQALPRALSNFTARLSAARQEVFNDPALQGSVTQQLARPTKFRASRSLSKSTQVHAVVGEGGLADDFIKAVHEGHDPVRIEALARAMKNRLSRWGPKSVDAADSPALANLAATADAFITWAKAYQENSRDIDQAIHGEAKTQAALRTQQAEWRGEQFAHLKARQAIERDNTRATYDRKQAQLRSQFAAAMRAAQNRLAFVTRIFEEEAESAAARVTKHVLDTQIMPKLRSDITAFKNTAAVSMREARKKYLADAKIAKLEKDKAILKLSKKHLAEQAQFKKIVGAELAGMGEALAHVVALGRATQRFHQSVMDHPADEYRDAYAMLYEKHLDAHENTEELKHAASDYERRHMGLSEDRIAARRSDPQVIIELMATRFNEVFNQPVLGPELALMARQAAREAEKSAKDELRQLVAQGLRVQYIPAAVAADERLGRSSMDPIIGKGIPKPDMAKTRVWDQTPRKDDFALGINKAVIQALQRDATIDFAEHTLKPLTMTQAQVANFIDQVFSPEERVTGGNLPHEYAEMARKLGLTKFDPEAVFGFRLPRWGKNEVYLPSEIVKALNEMNKDHRGTALVGKATKVFRYSILGLSPRYTAHVIFGGSMMLALRSTPYAVTMIGAAARAMRDGTLPAQLGRHAVEEGFEEPVGLMDTEPGKEALRLWHEQGGRDMHNLLMGEHLETVQKVKAGAAKPVQVLRAAADLNFRFTRYVRDLQAAVAYLDGAAKAERKSSRVTVDHPDTGRPIDVSTERAVTEGIHHVQEVFGNLQRMSPLERQVAQTIMPFYGWQKHILGYVMSFPLDHPYRAMILSQMAYNASNNVPLAFPIRLQLLFQLGAPDANGNVNAVDIRSLDPFRDVANYASLTGFFESLNPALSAPLVAAFGRGATFGSSALYPTVTYNSFYGIETTTSQGNWLNALEQWVPQVGAAQTALGSMSAIRSTWNTNRGAAIKSILSSLNIPFVTPPINLKQLAAKGEGARFETAKAAAYNAFSSGDFSLISGYKTVPNPLNTAYEITPAQLQALYAQAQAANPTVAPIESLLPPSTPSGW